MGDLAELLDRSLAPRGPGQLYDIVRELGLPPDSDVVDLGCGEGVDALRLATHFGFRVLGLDPLQRHLDRAREARRGEPEEIASRVSFERGRAEAMPLPRSSADLVWCRDVLVRVGDLDAAYAEMARVLRPGGRALVHQVFATPLLEPRERDWLFGALGVVRDSADPASTDAAIEAAGLQVDVVLELGSEWEERTEESSGAVSRALLHAARLRRAEEHFRGMLGDTAYDSALADCLWQVYPMLGKLSPRIILLTRPG
ncbi:hypothetical protein DDE18_07315 [Nocardioides gansuensis]|uniref:Methyltransferase type 11 domain-containing protein n=1 Tax=Nocardioides gansuensis TaxID=2138300 RepID=A0A2T8FBN4_9ACTN|nr:class I SAM-dependent methyltransferase [Nocardioides gansuensis]PVG83128.1 hypothetical protein DDE18_07315 [Nocardioides gansuensis]